MDAISLNNIPKINTASVGQRYAWSKKDINLPLNPQEPIYSTVGVPAANVWDVEYSYDAHLYPYCVTKGEGDRVDHPRLSKSGPIVAQLRSKSLDVVQNYIGLDIDNPAHASWADYDPSLASWQATLDKLGEDSLLSQYSVAYTTRNGGRVLYALAQPSPVPDGEGITLFLINYCSKLNIKVDDISDWTRLYRLPKVTRPYKQGSNLPAEKTWLSPFFRMDNFPERTLSIGQLEAAGYSKLDITPFLKPKPSIIGSTYLGQSRPEDHEAFALIEHVSDTGRQTQTQLFKEAKKRIRKSSAADYILGDREIKVGERNSTLSKIVGSVVHALSPVEDMTPEAVYACILSTIIAWEVDPQSGDWRDVLWSMTVRFWESKILEAETDYAKSIDNATADAGKAVSLVDHLKTWSCHPISNTMCREDISIEEQMAAVRNIAIVSLGSVYYVLGIDGKYSNTHVNTTDKLTPHIRNLGMDKVIEIRDDKGNFLESNKIIKTGLTIVNEAVYSMDSDQHGTLVQTGDRQTLHLQINKRRTDLIPTFNQDVDEWLRLMFRGTDVDKALKWLAYSLDFEGGSICALSIRGFAGNGKGMLMEGLAECLENPCYATGNEISDKFNEMLSKTPFINVNEGWKNQDKTEISQSFKDIVGGSRQIVELKNGPKITVHCPVRIVLTANDRDLIRSLGGRGDVSTETFEAICERVLHFDTGPYASNWLRKKGGVAFTGKAGHCWVKGPGGKTSNYILAKHLLWLYKNRRKFGGPEGRFLVEGNLHKTEHSVALMLGPAMSAVVSVICARVTQRHKPAGMEIDAKGDLYVSVNAVLKMLSTQPEHTKIAEFRTIDGLLSRIGEPSTDANDNIRYKLNLDHIFRVAKSIGIANSSLKEMAEKYTARHNEGDC